MRFVNNTNEVKLDEVENGQTEWQNESCCRIPWFHRKIEIMTDWRLPAKIINSISVYYEYYVEFNEK